MLPPAVADENLIGKFVKSSRQSIRRLRHGKPGQANNGKKFSPLSILYLSRLHFVKTQGRSGINVGCGSAAGGQMQPEGKLKVVTRYPTAAGQADATVQGEDGGGQADRDDGCGGAATAERCRPRSRPPHDLLPRALATVPV